MASTKPVVLRPLTGMMDTRSTPDAIATGGLRLRQNFAVIKAGDLDRRSGWAKLGNKTPYNNTDLHDQLLVLRTQFQIRQPITLIHSAKTSHGVYKLFAATESTVYACNWYTGNWKVLADGYGTGKSDGTGLRFQIAQIGDTLVFTNGFDAPFYYLIGSTKTDGEYAQLMPDLDLIGLSRANVVFQWRGVLFFGDVTMDASQIGCRLVWSDENNPASFDPAKDESITGFQDLEFHETILGAQESGDMMLIYTTHGIWRMTVVGGEQTFLFKRIYADDENQKGCLAYRNTLITVGNVHLYAGRDTFYSFSPFQQRPSQTDWVHLASGTMFEEIDNNACESAVAGIFNDEVWVSYPRASVSGGLASRTLCLNWTFKCADYVDHGFSAFAVHRGDSSPALIEFILENGICDLAGLMADGYGYLAEKEGLPLSYASTAEFTPQSIYTRTPLVIGDITVEDYTQTEGDSDSLCALLGSFALFGFCKSCQVKPIFVGASTQDFCLKQIGGVFYRERCSNPTATGTLTDNRLVTSVGTYILDGYDSILRFAPAFVPGFDVRSQYLKLEYLAVPEATPPSISLRIGQSAQVSDPNTDSCSLVWRSMDNKPMTCAASASGSVLVSRQERPASVLKWNFVVDGPYLYFELKISGTGGNAALSAVSADLVQKTVRNR